MEKPTLPRAITAALLLAGSLALGACSKPDYEGLDNEFVVHGIVSDSESNGLVQVHENNLVVVRAEGKAAEWFSNKKGQGGFGLSEEFDFLEIYNPEPGSFFSCGHEEDVGEVYDVNGNEIEAEQLVPGQVVVIEGRIRASRYLKMRPSNQGGNYCTEHDLAVFESVRVVKGPLRS